MLKVRDWLKLQIKFWDEKGFLEGLSFKDKIVMAKVFTRVSAVKDNYNFIHENTHYYILPIVRRVYSISKHVIKDAEKLCRYADENIQPRCTLDYAIPEYKKQIKEHYSKESADRMLKTNIENDWKDLDIEVLIVGKVAEEISNLKL